MSGRDSLSTLAAFLALWIGASSGSTALAGAGLARSGWELALFLAGFLAASLGAAVYLRRHRTLTLVGGKGRDPHGQG
jgi:hypothetical protein